MKYIFLIATVAAAFFIGCNKNDIPTDGIDPINSVSLIFTATVPEEKPQTRVALSRSEEGKSILVKWRTEDKVQFFFKKQDGAVVKGSEEPVTVVPDTDDKKATFNVTLPEGVSAPYTVYLVHGATATTDGTKIEVDISPVGFERLEDLVTPLAGKAEVVTGSSTGNIALDHLGALHCLTLANYHTVSHNPGNTFGTTVSLDYAGDSWFYGAGSQYDLVSQSVTAEGSGAALWQQIILPVWESVQFAQWIMPNDNRTQQIKLKAGALISADIKPTRAPLEKGKAYLLCGSVNYNKTAITLDRPIVWAGSNIYWDEAGQKLTFDETVVDASQNSDLKQGVYFEWGSLVAFSPTGDATHDYTENPAHYYVPSFQSSNPSASTWKKGTGYYLANNYLGLEIPNGEETNAFLNEVEQNSDAEYVNERGDICQYLSRTGAVSGSWRMPTANELDVAGVPRTTSGEYIHYTTTSVPYAKFGSFGAIAGNKAGTTVIPSGCIYTVGNSVTRFPASGRRDFDAVAGEGGEIGRYWSSSARDKPRNAYYLAFLSDRALPFYTPRNYFLSVRCVRATN